MTATYSKEIARIQERIDSIRQAVKSPPRQYAGLTAAQLPENPNPAQLRAVFALTIESVYLDGVDEILEGPTPKGKAITGKFREGRKVFDVKIVNGEIMFQPSAEMTDEEFGG
jgi:hypothetical protein